MTQTETGTQTQATPERLCRLFAVLDTGNSAVLSRGGQSETLTVVRADAGSGAEVTFGAKTVWLPVRQLRTVYFAGVRVRLSVCRAFGDGARLSVEAPFTVLVRRPRAGGKGAA